MNKKKIISSLTIAGMLATTATGASVFAADDPATNKIGEYKNVIENTTIVPFKLQSDSDKVTENDLKIAYPGAIVKLTADQTKRGYLVTGDVVKINGADRTIVIYGDVNSDGVVDIFDANDILANVKGKANAPKLTEAQKEAARLSDRGEMSIFDVNAVLAVAKGKTPAAQMEVSKPATETQPEEVVAKVKDMEVQGATKILVKFDKDASKYIYTVTDNVTGKEVSKASVTFANNNKEATITTATAFNTNEGQTYTVKVVDTKGNTVLDNTFKYKAINAATAVTTNGAKQLNGTEINFINGQNIKNFSLNVAFGVLNDVETNVEVTLMDAANHEVIGTARAGVNAGKVEVSNFNASELEAFADGTTLDVKVKVYDDNGNTATVWTKTATATIGNIAAANKITKNTATPLEILSIDVSRTAVSTATATIKFKANDGTALNYKYAKKNTDEAKPLYDEVATSGTANANNVFTLAGLTDRNAEYKLYVAVADDATGERLDLVEITIPAYHDLLDVVTDIKKSGNNGDYVWTDNKNGSNVSKYVVTVYTNGNAPIGTIETSNKTVNILNTIRTYLREYEPAAAPAPYHIGVTAVAASASYADSLEVVEPTETYTPAAVAAPALTLVNDVTTRNLKATYAESAEASSYSVYFYKYLDGVVSTSAESQVGTVAKNVGYYDLTKAFRELGLAKAKYDVKAKAIADTTSTSVDSAEGNAITVYNVTAPELTYSTDNTKVVATFNNVEDFVTAPLYVLQYSEVKSGEVTEFLDVNATNDATAGNHNASKGYISTASANATVTAAKAVSGDTNTWTLTGLKKNTEYKMYVAVYAGGFEIARTNELTITTPKDVATIAAGSKIVAPNDSVAGGKVKHDGNKIITTTDTYTKEDIANFDEIAAIIDKVVDVNGTGTDTLEVNTDGDIKVTLATAYAKTADFKNVLKDAEVTIASAASDRILADNVKSVKVAIDADLTGITTVEEKVTVSAAKIVNVANGVKVDATVANVTVNGVKATAATKIKKTGDKAYEVEAVRGGALGLTYDDDMAITIVHNSEQGAEGAITLTAKTADKTATLHNSGEKIALVVATNSVVNVSDAQTASIDISASNAKIETTSTKTLTLPGIYAVGATGNAEAQIIATSGTVTVQRNAATNAYTIGGNSELVITKSAAKDETKNPDVRTVEVVAGSGLADIESTTANKGYTITTNGGTVRYSVAKDTDNNMVLDVTSDSEYVLTAYDNT